MVFFVGLKVIIHSGEMDFEWRRADIHIFIQKKICISLILTRFEYYYIHSKKEEG